MRVSSDFISAAKGGRDLSCPVANGCSAAGRTAGERTRELSTNVSASSVPPSASLAQTVDDFLAHLDTEGNAHAVSSSTILSSQQASGISSKCDDQKLYSSTNDQRSTWEGKSNVKDPASAARNSHTNLDALESDLVIVSTNRSKNQGNLNTGSNYTTYLHNTQRNLPFLNEINSNETLSQLINRILGKPAALTAEADVSFSCKRQTANTSVVTGATSGAALENESLVNGFESLPDPNVDSETGSEDSTAQFAGLEFKTIDSHDLQAYERLMVCSDLGTESCSPVALDR